MTRPKNEPRVSEKRPYSYATGVTKRRDKCLDADEISLLYRIVGWIGPVPNLPRDNVVHVVRIWADIDEYNDIHMGSI
jgi:hypothetical protein